MGMGPCVLGEFCEDDGALAVPRETPQCNDHLASINSLADRTSFFWLADAMGRDAFNEAGFERLCGVNVGARLEIVQALCVDLAGPKTGQALNSWLARRRRCFCTAHPSGPRRRAGDALSRQWVLPAPF